MRFLTSCWVRVLAPWLASPPCSAMLASMLLFRAWVFSSSTVATDFPLVLPSGFCVIACGLLLVSNLNTSVRALFFR